MNGLEKVLGEVYEKRPFNAFASILRFEGERLAEELGGNCVDQANYLGRRLKEECPGAMIERISALLVRHVAIIFKAEDDRSWYFDPFLQQVRPEDVSEFMNGNNEFFKQSEAYPRIGDYQSILRFRGKDEELTVEVERFNQPRSEWAVRNRFVFNLWAGRNFAAGASERRLSHDGVYYQRPFVSLRCVDQLSAKVSRVMFRTKERCLSVGFMGQDDYNFSLTDRAIERNSHFGYCAERLGVSVGDLRGMVVKGAEYYERNNADFLGD